jgi:ferric iron reductase protein FhuF
MSALLIVATLFSPTPIAVLTAPVLLILVLSIVTFDEHPVQLQAPISAKSFFRFR